MVRGPRCTRGFAGGLWTARSSGCSGPPRRKPTRPVTSTGSCRPAPPWPGLTSTLPGPENGLRGPGLGRPRGGLTSKIHLACDALGRPLAFTVTGGNANDCTQFTAVMDAIRVPRPGPALCPARSRHRRQGLQLQSDTVLAQTAGIGHTIPQRSDQIRNRLRRGSRGGRPLAFGQQIYTWRNVVERCFNRVQQWRGIATRYEKTAESSQAAVTLASLLIWA
ncbi:IS5 family transposase [Streptomyces sp. NPDC018045]|uniref:IS5 family transposase n=1 Tax=Streptomyces sp. NPDC018045 TaxID=3365037 RepID=UPI0037B95879